MKSFFEGTLYLWASILILRDEDEEGASGHAHVYVIRDITLIRILAGARAGSWSLAST